MTTAAVAVVGSLVLCWQAATFYGGLFFVPFSFGPLAITLWLSVVLRASRAQTLLTISSVAYAAWFGYVYLLVFYIAPDPQAPIAFVFVGFYALPVLAVFWIAAVVVQRRAMKRTRNDSVQGGGGAESVRQAPRTD